MKLLQKIHPCMGCLRCIQKTFIHIGNGTNANSPIIITIQGHTFEFYTMVSETHINVGVILGLKTFVELGAEFSVRESKVKLLSRLPSVIPVHRYVVSQKKRGT